MAASWERQGERGALWAMRLLFGIARLLGRRVARLVLYPVAGYFLLTGREARQLPANCWVIDLSCELPETPSLRHERYRHVPLLDLHRASTVLLERLGPADSKRLFVWSSPGDLDRYPAGISER